MEHKIQGNEAQASNGVAPWSYLDGANGVTSVDGADERVRRLDVHLKQRGMRTRVIRSERPARIKILTKWQRQTRQKFVISESIKSVIDKSLIPTTSAMGCTSSLAARRGSALFPAAVDGATMWLNLWGGVARAKE